MIYSTTGFAIRVPARVIVKRLGIDGKERTQTSLERHGKVGLELLTATTCVDKFPNLVLPDYSSTSSTGRGKDEILVNYDVTE